MPFNYASATVVMMAGMQLLTDHSQEKVRCDADAPGMPKLFMDFKEDVCCCRDEFEHTVYYHVSWVLQEYL